MEEDSAVQAPVTRLRRRLSVEQSEDVNSPGPATPTKKRGGRLAAKPQLELIDENAGRTSKRTTKKTVIKELAEVTDEKPLTPSRRSTRIKSNTSIVSETTQSYESPRAKRAARRISQVGSDNESTVTPIRQTRRTRKDSTSSNDKLEVTLSAKPANITEAIIEEDSTSHNSKVSTTTNDTSSNQSLRKSPQLKGKQKDNEQSSADQSCENLNTTCNNTLNDMNIVNDSKATQNNAIVIGNENINSDRNTKKLSDISLNLINELDNDQKRKVSKSTNKSMTALSNPNSFKTERQRTKSLTAISKSNITESAFFSDNEQTKKKVKKNKIQTDVSKDIMRDINIKQDKLHKSDLEIVHSEINGKPISEVSTNMSFESISKEVRDVNVLQGSKEKIQTINIEAEDTISNAMFSKNASRTSLQSTPLLEESHTGTKSNAGNKTFDSEDQCVPVVESIENCENVNTLVLNNSNNKITEATSPNSLCLNKNEIISKNDSCEPMDIDVTIPNNTLISESSQLNKSSESRRKSNLQAQESNKTSSNLNKSSPLLSTQNLEKSETENKSTLIISQLKDTSSAENDLSKSSRPHQEVLSKSTSAIINDNTVDKKNLSLDYSTSTPLQQKHFQKRGMQINTSLIEFYKKEIEKSNISPRPSKNDISKSTEIASSTEEESDTENSSKINSLLDAEADVASDDYESGDSQDEEERQYEAENEVLEKGETLDSEDDYSNDSDYEKDSFVVSSNEEDLDLLSGSGDDLAMSDNELTMSKRSKKKYNDRKIKEQKKASKEMFEARHKLDKSKTKSSQINSSDDSEDEVSGKQYKRRRINSSREDSHDKPMANESSIKKKAKKRVLSESECNDSVSKEQEITIFNKSVLEDDPLTVNLKQEPKTPLKDLNLSTVQIMDKIEEIDVQNNISYSKTNQTSDPLYSSMVDDESSSLSENSEIVNNYDSMLNQLNNDNNKSNNIHQKTKKNKSQILDELNLTNTKKPKKSKNIDIDVVDASQSKFEKTNKKQSNDESSSDSIDLHLLFSEDSRDCDSDKVQTQNEMTKVPGDDFIPLKRTPAKTNIMNEQDNEESTNSEIKFIIDTEGSKQNLDQSYTSSNTATKKKSKKKSLNISNSQELITNDSITKDEDDDKPLEIPFKSSKNNQSAVSLEQHKDAVNTSSSGSAKKKKKHSLPHKEQTEPIAEATSPSNRDNVKKKKNHSESQLEDSGLTAVETSLISQGKKKKNLSLTHLEDSEQNAAIISPAIRDSGKKKKKKLSESQLEDSEPNAATISPAVRDSAKKKKKLSESQFENSGTDTKEISPNNHGSVQKKKNLSSQLEEPDFEVVSSADPVTKSPKKQKQKKTLNLSLETAPEESPTEVVTTNAKKRKRKSSSNNDIENNLIKECGEIAVVPETINSSLSAGREKKKRKISQNDTREQSEDKADLICEETKNTGDSNKQESLETPSSLEGAHTKKNKKRKIRDGDNESKIAKKLKENSFDTVHVPRLPASILSQLDDKPNKTILDLKKSKVISTTPFLVEETKKRKNKPSFYLEESVYLNDSNSEKKPKPSLKKPKVLPFVPTAATSDCGFTTKFQINVIPQQVHFAAKATNSANFKNDYLYGNKIKRLGTYEMYKKGRPAKLSKF